MTHARRNIKSAAVIKLITPITSFITRTVLIYSLGTVYLGLNGLFTAVIQVLSLAELGFGSAMVFSLYKPMAEDDRPTICALLFAMSPPVLRSAPRLSGPEPAIV